ncbi:hypothetical protein QFZ72_003311 [Bacillus sp. V2I10]|nr:hypothetical protein [Bacillus sp. V2I10]
MKGGIDLEPSNLFQIIDDLSNHSIQLLCHLAKVSRSGYYKWVKRKALPSEKLRTTSAISPTSMHETRHWL